MSPKSYFAPQSSRPFPPDISSPSGSIQQESPGVGPCIYGRFTDLSQSNRRVSFLPCDRCPVYFPVAHQGARSTVVVGPPAGNLQGISIMQDKLLTRAEVANLLNVCLRTVDRLRKQGLIRAVNVLSAVRIRSEDVQALLDSQRSGR
jgi:excisionase family DNA binding protein